jgi:hypothetical protein
MIKEVYLKNIASPKPFIVEVKLDDDWNIISLGVKGDLHVSPEEVNPKFLEIIKENIKFLKEKE